MGQYLKQYPANVIYDIHSTWGNLASRLGQCLFHSWGRVEKNIGAIYIFVKMGQYLKQYHANIIYNIHST